MSKLSDASAELAEVIVWLDFSRDFEYLKDVDYGELLRGYDEVGAMLHSMMDDPKKFIW